jgi:hypothetical protein
MGHLPLSSVPCKYKKALGRTNSILSFDTARTAQKTTRPTILLLLPVYSGLGKVFTEPLPNNTHIEANRLMGGVYKVRRSDGPRCHDIHIKFHRELFSHSKVDSGGDTRAHRQQGDLISLLLFFQNKESRLKMDLKETGWEGVDLILLTQDGDK